jgi:hypothetical protein
MAVGVLSAAGCIRGVPQPANPCSGTRACNRLTFLLPLDSRNQTPYLVFNDSLPVALTSLSISSCFSSVFCRLRHGIGSDEFPVIEHAFWHTACNNLGIISTLGKPVLCGSRPLCHGFNTRTWGYCSSFRRRGVSPACHVVDWELSSWLKVSENCHIAV